jgi:hypothetical protein
MLVLRQQDLPDIGALELDFRGFQVEKSCVSNSSTARRTLVEAKKIANDTGYP